MKLVDTDETIVLVTGTGLVAEEKDRPLAYQLKAEIDQRGVGHAFRRGVVVGDAWYLENQIFHLNPTIAIGGPGANGVAGEFVSELPIVWQHENRAYVQLEYVGDVKRVVLWGMDGEATALALAMFIQNGMLSDLIERIWKFREGSRLT